MLSVYTGFESACLCESGQWGALSVRTQSHAFLEAARVTSAKRCRAQPGLPRSELARMGAAIASPWPREAAGGGPRSGVAFPRSSAESELVFLIYSSWISKGQQTSDVKLPSGAFC